MMDSIQISKVQIFRITSVTIVFSVLLLGMVNFSSNPVIYTPSNQVIDLNSPNDFQPFREKLSSIETIHAYTDSLPLLIDNNTDFNSTANSKGWAGNGSIINPFIIENLNITNSTSYIKLIEIKNTDVFFEIKNCYFSNGSDGIRLQNVTHGKIYNNIIINCSDHGMDIRESKNNTISNNNVYRGGLYSDSIYLSKTNNSIISNNTIANYKGEGIRIENSKNNTLFNNTIHEGSGPYSNCIEFWNVNHSLVHNNSVYNNTRGIRLFYSHFNTFSNMYIFNINASGLNADYSSHLTISNCYIFKNNGYGMSFSYTVHSIITNSVFYLNAYYGFTSSVGASVFVSNNTFSNNDFIANSVSHFEPWAKHVSTFSFTHISIHGSGNNVTHNFYDTYTSPNTNSDGYVDTPLRVGGYPHISPGYIYDSFPLIAPSNTIFSLHNYTFHYLSRPSLVYPVSRHANDPNSLQVVPFRGIETIEWNPSIDSADERINYSLYYQPWFIRDEYKGDNWTIVIKNILGLSYTFNTTSLPEGRGRFKIGARNAEGMQINSTYQEVMIDNSITTLPDQVTPGFSFLACLSLILVMIPYRRKKR